MDPVSARVPEGAEPAPTRATLEPVVASIERARFLLDRAHDVEPGRAVEARTALDAAQTRLVQLWFGDDRGQDTLFADAEPRA